MKKWIPPKWFPPVHLLQNSTEVFGPPLKYFEVLGLQEALDSCRDEGMFTHAAWYHWLQVVHSTTCSPMAIWHPTHAINLTAMLFGSFVQCFHLAICACTPVTLIFILTLD